LLFASLAGSNTLFVFSFLCLVQGPNDLKRGEEEVRCLDVVCLGFSSRALEEELVVF
jgi:hypothetical protein